MSYQLTVEQELFSWLSPKKGHFKLESGHHGDLWLDLELLCLDPNHVSQFASQLTRRLEKFRAEVVCGPLVEGAFIALMLASELKVQFSYAERVEDKESGSLFPVRYIVPQSLRGKVEGKRVAIVNDVINAGSAVRGTFSDLKKCGAEVVALGSLLVLGSAAETFAAENNVPLVSVGQLPNHVWAPEECPLCLDGVPFTV